MSATLTVHQQQAALNSLIRRWDRRARLAQSLQGLPFSMMPGFAAGIILAIISRVRPLMLPHEILTLSVLLALAGAVLFLLAVWLRRRSSLHLAQRFDVLLGLGERVSTALELLDGRIRTTEELIALQLADARDHAREAQVAARLPLTTSRRAWAMTGALVLGLIGLLMLPNPQAAAIAQESAQIAAIEEAAETLRQITEDVAADAGLTNEERESLLQALESARQTLNQPQITPQEAFAAVTEAQSALQDAASLFNQRLNNVQTAMSGAAEALNRLTEPTSGSGLEQLQQALEQLQQQLQTQAGFDPQAMASALSQAGAALQNTDPATAQALQQAAQQLQQGNQQAAQQRLSQAQQQLNQTAQQHQQRAQTAQNTQRSAEQAQQTAQQLSEASQQGQQRAQQGQQQANTGENQQADQNPRALQGQAGQQSEQTSQQGQASAPGQEGEEGENPAQGQGAQSDQGQQAVGAQPQAGDQPGAGLSGAAVMGAGDSEAAQTEEQIAPASAESSGESPSNNPDGQGQGGYEQIYAPRRIGGAPGQDQIVLEPEDSGAPVIEGNFSENAPGEATVSYNQVFSDYRSAANEALNSGRIPLFLRDIVRNYFISLEPR